MRRAATKAARAKDGGRIRLGWGSKRVFGKNNPRLQKLLSYRCGRQA